MTKDSILQQMGIFSLGGDGIGGWIKQDADELIFDRLGQIDTKPLTKVSSTNSSHSAMKHPCPTTSFITIGSIVPRNIPMMCELPDFTSAWLKETAISSLAHLMWGLYRLFTDGLLYFGNVRTAYRKLRALNRDEIQTFFAARRFQTKLIKDRGPSPPA
jgi:hypothetical protein